MPEGYRNGVIPGDACLRQDEGMQERYFIQAPLPWYEQVHKRRALALMGAVAAPVVMQCRSWYRNSLRFRICLHSAGENPRGETVKMWIHYRHGEFGRVSLPVGKAGPVSIDVPTRICHDGFRIYLQSTESPFTFRSSSNQTFIQGSPERLPFLFEGRQGTVHVKVAHNATKDVLLVDINDRPMYGFNIRTANRGLSHSRTGAEPRA